MKKIWRVIRSIFVDFFFFLFSTEKLKIIKFVTGEEWGIFVSSIEIDRITGLLMFGRREYTLEFVDDLNEERNCNNFVEKKRVDELI